MQTWYVHLRHEIYLLLHAKFISLFSRTFRVSSGFGASSRIITNCPSISTFLTRSCFDDYVQEANSLSGEGSAVIPLVDSVMAFGYRTLLAASQQSKSSEMRRKAIIYSSIALRSRDKVLRSPETLHKMQVRDIPSVKTVHSLIHQTILAMVGRKSLLVILGTKQC